MAGFATYPTVFSGSLGRGRVYDSGFSAVGVARFSTDSIGNFVLTLNNVIVGSNIQVDTLTGTPLLFTTASASTVVINLSAYQSGSSANNLRIKIRKGSSSPYYQPWETQATAFVGSQTIFVSQIPDE